MAKSLRDVWVGLLASGKVPAKDVAHLRSIEAVAPTQGLLLRKEDGVVWLEEHPLATDIDRSWQCQRCGSLPVTKVQPTTDIRRRWGLATCGICEKPSVIFVHREDPA